MSCISNWFSANPFQLVLFCVYFRCFGVLLTSVPILSPFSDQLSVFALFLFCFGWGGRSQSFVSHASATSSFPKQKLIVSIITFVSQSWLFNRLWTITMQPSCPSISRFLPSIAPSHFFFGFPSLKLSWPVAPCPSLRNWNRCCWESSRL